MFKKILAAGITALALSLAATAGAHAENDASGALMTSEGGAVGEFTFNPAGEKVRLYDAQPDRWGMLLELWWDGKLRRWCYNTKGANSSQRCDFNIPEGKRITFYLAEISWAWFDCKRQGCGKRKHMWAGPTRNGCQVAPKGWPCGYPGATGTAPETLDFRGVA
jgi:hypothetical protein